MASSVASPQVLIAGAGPTGLVLAICLRLNGVSVRIIDKEPNHRLGQRGTGHQPRTLEVYKFIGALKNMHDHFGALPPVKLYDMNGENKNEIKTLVLAEQKELTPSVPYPNSLTMGQTRAEAFLRAHLETLGTFVELGTELRSFKQESDQVFAEIMKLDAQKETTVPCKFLVGTDGAKGIVRKQLGLTFLGESHTDKHILFGDFRMTADLDRHYWHMWGSLSTMLVAIRPTEELDDDLWNYAVFGPETPYDEFRSSPDKLLAFVKDFTKRSDFDIGEIVWSSEYTPNIRMVDTFNEGRVFVAGDAAHVHSPTGGQGLNSSVQDAFNLSWKMSLVLQDRAPITLLASYNDERLPVIKEMLNLSTELFHKTFTDQEGGWERGGNLHQLGVNCRWSGIVVDEENTAPGESTEAISERDAYGAKIFDGRLHAGDRAPQAPGLRSGDSTTTLFDIFKPTYHTALVFVDSPDNASDILGQLRTWAAGTVRVHIILPKTASAPVCDDSEVLVLIDCEGYAYGTYRNGASGGKGVVIVRPDGVIGALVCGVDGLQKYRSAVFGQ